MTMLSLGSALAFATVAALASLATLIIWARIAQDPDQSIHNMLRRRKAQSVFLFSNHELVDCSPSAKRLLEGLSKAGNDLQTLLTALSPRFIGLPSATEVQETGLDRVFHTQDPQDGLSMKLENWNGYLRATIIESDDDAAPTIERSLYAAQKEELTRLRTATNSVSTLMWKTDTSGEIVWANEAYFELLRRRGNQQHLTWPPEKIFADGVSADLEAKSRKTVTLADKTVSYELCGRESDDGVFYFASSIDHLVDAEDSQNAFVQTLTKTFAHLSTGLAIFDKNRELTLFNPALLELMNLPFDFLSRRPTFHAFLDRLREEKRIAEPKDFKAWRTQLLDLENRAKDGSYTEHWSLPGGITFRVTGRPHPDGAIAFLFEDISAEVSLTRRFQAEIELVHAALDAMDEALVLVSNTGSMSFANLAYRDLWEDEDPDSLVVGRTLRDAIAHWADLCESSAALEAIAAKIGDRRGSRTWARNLSLKDGRSLRCRCQRISGGAVLIGFREIPRASRGRISPKSPIKGLKNAETAA